MYEFDPANSSDPAYPALYTTIDLVYCKCGRCTVHIVHTRVSMEELEWAQDKDLESNI